MVKSGTQSYDSSAIKIGKSRTVGSGKGLIVSNGALNIDMDPNFGGRSAYMSSAIKMAVSGSELQANEPNSSTYINASRSVLAIGIDDWGTSVDSTGIKASFGNATIKTQSITAPLLLVDSVSRMWGFCLIDTQISLPRVMVIWSTSSSTGTQQQPVR